MDYGFFSGDSNLKVLVQGFAMILASEIGDKTFLIAAILAMRHPRGVVFAGAFGALAVMSMLSAALGHVLPTLIPKSATQLAASVLFFVFGVKMLMEGREMKSGNEKIEEEMREAQEEIEEDDAREEGTGGTDTDGHAIPLEELERGQAHESSMNDRRGARKVDRTSIQEGARNFFSLFLGPVFVQAFALTFLGEWGDRSQIATIALGAAHVCPRLVWASVELTLSIECVYRIIGHNRWARVLHSSRRHWRKVYLYQNLRQTRSGSFSAPIRIILTISLVTLGGAALFIIFGFIYLYEAFRESSEHALGAPDHENPADLLH